MQIVAGGVTAKSRHVGCVAEVDAANLRALNHANRRASEIATPAATKLNQSYCPGSQNSALFAANSDNKLRPKKSHFIELVPLPDPNRRRDYSCLGSNCCKIPITLIESLERLDSGSLRPLKQMLHRMPPLSFPSFGEDSCSGGKSSSATSCDASPSALLYKISEPACHLWFFLTGRSTRATSFLFFLPLSTSHFRCLLSGTTATICKSQWNV